MNEVLKKVLPKSYTLNTMEKPMHSGEIYHLWECLIAGFQLVELLEAYYMNTEDKNIQKILKSFTNTTQQIRISELESILKAAGFTVPPKPASKALQGSPGVGQEVTLSDEEVIKVLYNWVTGVMNLDVRGIATVTTNNKIRGIFKDIINTDMEFHEQLLTIGKERNALEVAPPATSAQSSLSMTEVSWLWLHIDTSQTDILQLETFMNNTKDKELLGEIQHELSKIFYPRLKQIEDLLKKEGFTVPSRPADRSQQQPEGRTNKIVLQDNEIISFLYTSAEVSMNNHLRAFSHAFRDDMRKLFKDFLFIEIENLERILKLAIKRNTLVKPPFVTSKRG